MGKRSIWRGALGAALFATVLAFPGAVAASTPASHVLHTGLPDHALTPGVYNAGVTQATIHRTICVSGWTSRIRPPTSYTTPLKRRQLVYYRFVDRNVAHYEEDHLVSLELGGSAWSAKNLFPEPHHIWVGGVDVGSYTKDGFENYLRRKVCAGSMTLARARAEIRRDWVHYWKVAGKPRG